MSNDRLAAVIASKRTQEQHEFVGKLTAIITPEAERTEEAQKIVNELRAIYSAENVVILDSENETIATDLEGWAASRLEQIVSTEQAAAKTCLERNDLNWAVVKPELYTFPHRAIKIDLFPTVSGAEDERKTSFVDQVQQTGSHNRER